jgi:hypothetical protein
LFYNSVDYENYKNIISRSIFTLAPRGFGYTSFRLFEAILGGSIPIYIWDEQIILPYSDELDWNEFCIIINSNDISNLPNVLKTVDIPKMQNKVETVKQLFTFNKITEYVTKIIESNNNINPV